MSRTGARLVGLTFAAFLRRLTIHMMNILMPGETDRIASVLLSSGDQGLILEVGGGISHKTASMVGQSKVVNVDLSFASLSQVPWRKGSSEEKVLASALWLPFRGGCFDSATVFEVLEHIVEDSRGAQEIERSVKDSGLIHITVPSDKWRYPHLKYPLQKFLFPREDELGLGHVRRGYSTDQISLLFPRCVIVSSGYYMSFLGGLFYDLRFSRVGRVVLLLFPVLLLLKSFYHFSSSHGPGFGTCVYVTIKKPNSAQ